MEKFLEIEHDLITRFRKRIWANFVKGVKEYNLIEENDKIAVCISGGKDSFLMAKLMQEISLHGDFPLELVFLVMDPGYKKENRELIESNAKLLNIPLTIIDSDIFECVDRMGGAPCYMCARMRRGFLYAKAKELGCNKIALGHHFNDVIETLLMSMFYSSEVKSMPPKLRSDNFSGMELIRPMYFIREKDIITWKDAYDLKFLQCACKLTEGLEDGRMESKRSEVKRLIAELKLTNPDIELNLFNSLHNINLDAINGYRQNKTYHSFNEMYEKNENESEWKRNTYIKYLI